MLEWDILNYLKKWRTNLRATAGCGIQACNIQVHMFEICFEYHILHV